MSSAWEKKDRRTKLRGGGGGLGFDTAERHAEQLEQLATFFVVGGGGHDGDIEAHRFLHVLDGDLRENGEIGHTEVVVALAVELRRNAAEVADRRERDRKE